MVADPWGNVANPNQWGEKGGKRWESWWYPPGGSTVSPLLLWREERTDPTGNLKQVEGRAKEPKSAKICAAREGSGSAAL